MCCQQGGRVSGVVVSAMTVVGKIGAAGQLPLQCILLAFSSKRKTNELQGRAKPSRTSSKNFVHKLINSDNFQSIP
jgi:hypothetical protein